MQENISIGRNIRKWRTFKGYKQQHLASKLGISRATLSKYENGHTAITFLQLQAIASELQMEIQQLADTNSGVAQQEQKSNYQLVFA